MLNVIKEFTKTFGKKFKHKKQHTKITRTHVKNLRRQLITKDFLWRL